MYKTCKIVAKLSIFSKPAKKKVIFLSKKLNYSYYVVNKTVFVCFLHIIHFELLYHRSTSVTVALLL